MTQQIFTTVSETELREMVQKQVEEAIKSTSLPPQNPDELLTRNDVKDLLGISLVTLHDWTKRGIIPTLRIGTRIRFKKSDVMAALNQVESLKYRRY